MPNRGKVPSILWGAAFVNTLLFEYPLDSVVTYSMSRDGGETLQGRSGIEEAWVVGYDQMLAGDARWLRGVASGGITGWDGATGWRAFLEWAWAKNVFRFCPDNTAPGTYFPCYLVEPSTTPPEPESDFTRKLHVIFRTSDQSAFTGY